jgi:hypothetical protein
MNIPLTEYITKAIINFKIFSGAYTVYVRDKNGCGIVTDKVYLLMYPKFFTPNGDGYNDTWSIHFQILKLDYPFNYLIVMAN